jgi:hypothetical protein
MERDQQMLAAGPSGDCELSAEEFAAQISNADLIRYVGDMVDELHLMCQRTGCATLLGLLALARAEAMLQQHQCRPRRSGEII